MSMNHREAYLKRMKTDLGLLQPNEVSEYIFRMLDMESFAANLPDVEIMRFTIKRIPCGYNIFADLIEWVNTREINSRSVGVISYFLCEYADIFNKADVDILTRLSRAMTLPAMECHHPDWLIAALSFGAILTRDDRLMSIVKEIDQAKVASINPLAVSTYNGAMNLN